MSNRDFRQRRNFPAQQRHAYAAFKASEDLGRLNAKRPAGYEGDDRFPLLAAGQVYATRAGAVFHPAPCPAVRSAFAGNPRNVVVILGTSTGRRSACRTCPRRPDEGDGR